MRALIAGLIVLAGFVSSPAQSTIFACINTTTATLQIKAEGAACPSGSKAVEFYPEGTKKEQPIVGWGSTFRPGQCQLETTPGTGGSAPVGGRFKNRDYTRAVMKGSWLDCIDFSGSTFNNAIMEGQFERSIFRNAKFKNAYLRDNFQFALFDGADLTNALMNADFYGADLRNAVLDGVVWADSRCPDGTYSVDNGGTCIGHLTPGLPE